MECWTIKQRTASDNGDWLKGKLGLPTFRMHPDARSSFDDILKCQVIDFFTYSKKSFWHCDVKSIVNRYYLINIIIMKIANKKATIVTRGNDCATRQAARHHWYGWAPSQPTPATIHASTNTLIHLLCRDRCVLQFRSSPAWQKESSCLPQN